MSVNMDGMESTDYSDYEYQSLNIEIRLDSLTIRNPNASGNATIEPLSDRGGLDNNEVAELVAFKLVAAHEFEDENADQNVATQLDSRIVFGMNLPAERGFMPLRAPANSGVQFDTKNDNTELAITTRSRTEDRILDYGQVKSVPSFDDETNGPGGGDVEMYQSGRNYRDVTGRGPVLDSNDNIGINANLNAGDITDTSVALTVHVHLIWDTAEVSDAGRAFSVPTDD